MELVAYELGGPAGLVPMARERDWMAATPEGFARRCLPLLVANELGWAVTLPNRVTAAWNGGAAIEDLWTEAPAVSHFGEGVVSWAVPFLFRTPPGWDLLVKGPPNAPKDGVAPLEGVVETWWSAAPFTMNWRFTRPCTVTWEEGEAFCCIVPVRTGELGRMIATRRPLSDDPELAERHGAWAESRGRFLAEETRAAHEWQRHYMRGADVDGDRRPGHRTRLGLSTFKPPAG